MEVIANNTDYINAMKRYKYISKKYNIPTGFHVVNCDDKTISFAISNDFQFIALGIDTVFMSRSAKEALNKSRYVLETSNILLT